MSHNRANDTWTAYLYLPGRQMDLGTFDTFDAAYKAYLDGQDKKEFLL